MSGGIYGGDDVGAIVLDPGHHSFRAGYAGEEYPKIDLPQVIGIRENSHGNNVTCVSPTSWRAPVGNTEIVTYMQDGMISNFDHFQEVLNHVYQRELFAESKNHPILMSEPSWSNKVYREKLAELMFEKYETPAFFLGKTPVLVCFANMKTTGLVFDSGAHCSSATPVYDGYVLTSGIVKTSLAGNTLVHQIRHMLKEKSIEVVPPYKIASKELVRVDDRPKWRQRKIPLTITTSFEERMKHECIEDFIKTVLHVSDVPFNPDDKERMSGYQYEFPNGFIHDFVDERLRIPESLFDVSYLKNVDKSTVIPLAQVIASSINMVDVEIRPAMYNGITLTGGNTLLNGFFERLTNDLQRRCPSNCKLRVSVPQHSSQITSERRFGPWVGGSVLASLGSFQQMWVSRQEYDEGGKAIVEKKCP